MASKAFLQQAYLAYFGRPADPSGLAYYAEKTEAQVKAAFSASPESQAFFGSLEIGAQINAIYQNLFNRDAEPAGLTYWAQEIGSGRLSLADAAMGILAGAQNDDKKAVANKLAASDSFTTALNTTAEILGYAGAAAIAPARAYLKAVDSTTASLTAAVAGVDASVTAVVAAGTAVAGQTYTLTTGVDNITGTAGNDTVSAVFDENGSNSTLQIADLINGGAGRDTLSIRYTDSHASGSGASSISASTTPELKNIEVLEVSPLAGGGTISLAGIGTSLDTINVTNAIGSAAFTGVRTAVKTVGVSNVAQDGADVSVTYTTGLTGTGDAVTLNLSAVAAASASSAASGYAEVNLIGGGASGSADGVDIINVMSNGTSANRLDVLAAKDNASGVSTLKTVTIEGTAALRVNTDLASTVKTIDASKAAGGVNLGVASGDNVTFTGGEGNDRINMGTGLTTDDKLTGGNGVDTLAISQAKITNDKTASINKAIEAQTGFEKLEITNVVASGSLASGETSALSIDARGLVAIKQFVFSGGAASGNLSVASGGTAGVDAIALTGFASDNTNSVEISATYFGGAASGSGGSKGGDALDVTPGTNGPADEVTITLKGITLNGGAGGAGASGTNAGDGGHGINATQFETVNIVSTGSLPSSSNTLAGGAGGASGTGFSAGNDGKGILVNTNGVINVTGANDLTFTAKSADETSGGVQVKAGTFTGKLNVTGTTANDSFIGGTKDDIIKGGAGVDTIDLSKGGKDTVVLTDVTTAANRDVITGFGAGAGGDILDITTAGSTATLKAITGTSTAFTLTTDDVTVFNFAGTNNSANLAGATNGAELFKAIANQGSTISALTTATADTGYIVAYDGTNAYVYYFDAGSSSTELLATEIALVGTLNNVATGSLVVGNFA